MPPCLSAAGLADQAREINRRGEQGDRKMVLKALHPFLDDCRVAAICISNTPLDAANSNRMVTLTRSRQQFADLCVLAMGCLGFAEPMSADAKGIVEGLCQAYIKLQELQAQEGFAISFHDRDFIYTLRHLNRSSASPAARVNPTKLLHALEENFNGVPADQFHKIVQTFFDGVDAALKRERDDNEFLVPTNEPREMLDIIRSHLYAKPAAGKESIHQLKPRFILLIDPSPDDLAVRLMASAGVLKEGCRVLHVSPFVNDSTQAHLSRYVSETKFLMEKGETVIMINAESILGSFFDLFNQVR